jgi:hypothetical protein
LKDELNGLLKVASVTPVGKGLGILGGKAKYLQEALSKAKATGGHPEQLMHELDDGTKILFRKDFGSKAHSLGGPYQGRGVTDHYNVQVQNSKGKTVENLHLVPDGNGGMVVWGIDEVIRK